MYMTLSLDFEIIWISNNLYSGAPVKSLRLIIWHVTCRCLSTCIACVKMCVCPVQMRVCTRGTWFQLSVTVSAGTQRRPRKNSSSNNSKGWRYTAEIIASLKTSRPSPPVFWREHMFACLYFCQQSPLQWQRPKRTLLLVCRGEESFPVRHGWYDDSFHSNALVWFLCKHGYEKCFLGGRHLRWRQNYDISHSKKELLYLNW